MNNENPLVSIIIATYNRSNTVVKSIESALNQTYGNIEVVVVEDGSSDDTVKILKENFGEKIILNVFEKNQGATFARNTGLKMAKGEYAIVWDSDDILYPEAVETLIQKAKEFPEALTISAPTKVFKSGQELKYEILKEGFISAKDIFCGIMPKFKLVRMSKTLAHQEKEILYKGKNLDFMINNELITSGAWYYTSVPLADHFLLSDRNSLTIGRRKLNAQASMNRTNLLVEHIDKYKSIYLDNCPRRYSDYAYGAILGFVLKGEIKNARKLAKESFFIYKNFRNFCTLIWSYFPLNSLLLNFLYKLPKLW